MNKNKSSLFSRFLSPTLTQEYVQADSLVLSLTFFLGGREREKEKEKEREREREIEKFANLCF
jgi:hypothetical protein